MLYSIVKACLCAASEEMAHSDMALPSAAPVYVWMKYFRIHFFSAQAPKDKSDQHFAE